MSVDKAKKYFWEKTFKELFPNMNDYSTVLKMSYHGSAVDKFIERFCSNEVEIERDTYMVLSSKIITILNSNDSRIESDDKIHYNIRVLVKKINIIGATNDEIECIYKALFLIWCNLERYDFNHSLGVACSYRIKTIEQLIVALLHDVIENTNIELVDLVEKGFSQSTINSVRLLTRMDDISYGLYINTLILSDDIQAVTVKLADIDWNSSPDGNGRDGEHPLTCSALKRYNSARRMLELSLNRKTVRINMGDFKLYQSNGLLV